MNTGALHQLHDSRYKYILSVTDRIDLHFFAPDILIHQHRLISINLHSGVQIMAKLILVCNDLHSSAAQNKAGAHQYRIANLLSGIHTVFDFGNRSSFGLWNPQFCQQFFKGIPVFCLFNGSTVGTNDLHAQICQRLRKVNGGLSAKGCDHALRLLQCDDVHHILHRQRLKVQLIGGGVVRGNRFRIVVDDNGFITCVFDRLNGVNSGIVKFHALPDADRSGAKDNDLFLIRNNGFILRLVGGVKVRNIAVKLHSAGVDHPVSRANVPILSQCINTTLRGVPQPGNRSVREAHFLGRKQNAAIHRMSADLILHFHDFTHFADKERIDLTGTGDLFHRNTQPEQLRNGINAVICSDGNVGKQLLLAPVIKFLHMQMIHTDLKRTDAL